MIWKLVGLVSVTALVAIAYQLGKEMERQRMEEIQQYWDEKVGV